LFIPEAPLVSIDLLQRNYAIPEVLVKKPNFLNKKPLKFQIDFRGFFIIEESNFCKILIYLLSDCGLIEFNDSYFFIGVIG
jgi:hypothetical protein